MSNLQEYINNKYDGARDWFVTYVNEFHNRERILDVMHKKTYLDGDHKILKRQSYKHNGKTIEPKRIVLQYAKTLLNYQSSHLLENPITLTGDDNVVRKFSRVNRKGKYNRFNRKVLDKVLKYGQVAEYVYVDKRGNIKSKLIDADEGFPVYNENNELIAFVEAWVHDGISYYIVYSSEVVSKYSDEGGEIRFIEQYANLSGLPIIYHNDNELSDVDGKSVLDDWIGILDTMESILSKYADATEKFLDPIFINTGQQLQGDGLPKDIVGKGINLDDGADAKYLQAKLDKNSFETLWKTLQQSLLDISSTPAVSMNKTDISNMSEVSIKLLFQLANIQAGQNKMFMKDGIEDRFDKIRSILELQGTRFSDDKYDTLDIVFQYATPSNDSEIIENLKSLRELGGLSLESALEMSPYTFDTKMELDRLRSEGLINENDMSEVSGKGTDED